MWRGCFTSVKERLRISRCGCGDGSNVTTHLIIKSCLKKVGALFSVQGTGENSMTFLRDSFSAMRRNFKKDLPVCKKCEAIDDLTGEKFHK